MIQSSPPRSSQTINHLVIFIILILGIFTGVRLIQQPQPVTTQAQETPHSEITIIGSSDFVPFSSRNVKVKISYIGSSILPNSFKLANSMADLSSAQEQPLTANGQVVSWRLSAGNGQKTVFAQFKTASGWLPAFSTTVALDATSPNNFLVGATVPSIIDYPYNDILTDSHTGDIETDLQAIKGMNGSIVRVYVPDNKISNSEASRRLADFLSMAAKDNIQVIPVLIDDYNSSHNPQGTDQYYAPVSDGVAVLDHAFFESGYKTDYLSFVKQVVNDNKAHTNIYAWEIGNELKDPDSTQTLLTFMADVSSTINGLDPMHDIISGISNTQQLGLTPLQFYTTLPDIDIVSIHSYNGDHQGEQDAIWARQNFRQALVEVESLTGIKSDDRSPKLSQEISYWKNLGVSGILMSNFMAKGVKDNGDGDKAAGMDMIFHSDYDNLSNMLKSSAT